jgi:hypothetical protein
LEVKKCKLAVLLTCSRNCPFESANPNSDNVFSLKLASDLGHSTIYDIHCIMFTKLLEISNSTDEKVFRTHILVAQEKQ